MINMFSDADWKKEEATKRVRVVACRDSVELFIKVALLEARYLKSFFVVQNFNIALNKVDFIGAISFS